MCSITAPLRVALEGLGPAIRCLRLPWPVIGGRNLAVEILGIQQYTGHLAKDRRLAGLH